MDRQRERGREKESEIENERVKGKCIRSIIGKSHVIGHSSSRRMIRVLSYNTYQQVTKAINQSLCTVR